MDFTDLSRIPLDGTSTVLQPVYDPVLGAFSVQIHQGGVIYPLGLDGAFQYADEPLHEIDEALAKLGVRELTGDEAVLLYAGLVQAKGGPDWAVFRMQVARAEAN